MSRARSVCTTGAVLIAVVLGGCAHQSVTLEAPGAKDAGDTWLVTPSAPAGTVALESGASVCLSAPGTVTIDGARWARGDGIDVVRVARRDAARTPDPTVPGIPATFAEAGLTGDLTEVRTPCSGDGAGASAVVVELRPRHPGRVARAKGLIVTYRVDGERKETSALPVGVTLCPEGSRPGGQGCPDDVPAGW